MSHFTIEFKKFLYELKNNNNREWFTANKTRYENNVKIPFENFIQDLIYRIHEDNEDLIITPKEAIFRIYRDIIFSKDKTPYKTHVSAVIAKNGRKNYVDPEAYIEINSEYLRYYSGIYKLDNIHLEKVRRFINANLTEFDKLLNDKNFKKYFKIIRGEKSKRLTKEFKKTLEIQPLIANKQFYYFTEIDVDNILNKNLTQSLMKYYHAAKPMNLFLRRAIS
jgi:uncharacterized protein (TIGR02453 family)